MKKEHPLRGWAYFTYPARLCKTITPGQGTNGLFDLPSFCARKQRFSGAAYIETLRDLPIIDPSLGAAWHDLTLNNNDVGWRKIEMAKSYSEQLAEWVKRREESARRDRNLVAFLAVKDDVKEAVDAGYAVKTIWTHMCEGKRVTFGYDTFLKYVKRHVRQARHAAAPAVAAPPAQPIAPRFPSHAGPVAPGSSGPEPPAGFTFNAAPNKEELI